VSRGADATDLPAPRSIRQGYDVSAWCRACQHTVRLDLSALVAGGHGDVPLIHLLLRRRCGSDQFGVIVGAVSAGKWRSAPSAIEQEMRRS
jgi:hypothetical protein